MMNLILKIRDNKENLIWLFSAISLILLTIFLNKLFILFILSGVICLALEYKPQYFCAGKNINHPKISIIRDAVTYQPIPLAIIRLYSQKTNKLIQTIVSNKAGAFEKYSGL